MAAVTTAGSFVSAIMETAGLMTQSNYLLWFEEFFRTGGGLVYTIAAVGGIVSVMLYGSYRAAAYLLLGPAIFWFLLSPSTDVSASVFKIGGGSERNLYGQAIDEEDAVRAVYRSIEETEGFEGFRFRDSGEPPVIKVSSVYFYFLHFINSITNEFVDLILPDEDNKDLVFLSKINLFRAITEGQIKDSELTEMFVGDFMDGCETMARAGLALGNRNISPEMEQQTREEGNNLSGEAQQAVNRAAEEIRRTRAFFQDIWDREWGNVEKGYPGKMPSKSLTQAMRQFVTRQIQLPGLNNSKTAFFAFLNKRGLALTTTPDQVADELFFTCKERWGIVRDAIHKEAETMLKDLVPNYLGYLDDTPEHRNLLCQELAKKIGKNYPNKKECEEHLVEIYFVFILRNALEQNSGAAWLKQHLNRLTIPVSSRNGHVSDTTRSNTSSNPHVPVSGDLSPLTNVTPPGRKGAFNPNNTLFSSSTSLHDITAGRSQVRTRELRQKIFSFAMQMPYWQGILLYLIHISYPFMCLVVLVPGHAPAIKNVPLALLWVKSWDIGFAMVIQLEKITWGLFPNTDIPYELNTNLDSGNGAPVDISLADLPNILQEGLGADPSYHVQMHYLIVSIALLSVPAVTGYAIMKSSSSVLASFTDGMESAARDSAKAAGMAFEGPGQQMRVRNMQRFMGPYLEQAGPRGEGFSGGTRKGAAADLGMLKGMSSFAKGKFSYPTTTPGTAGVSKRGFGKLGAQVIQNGLNAAGAGRKTYGDIVNASARHALSYNRQIRGRNDRNALIQEAILASYSTSGFELQVNGGDVDGPWQPLIGLFSQKVRLARDIAGDLSEASIAQMTRLGKGGAGMLGSGKGGNALWGAAGGGAAEGLNQVMMMYLSGENMPELDYQSNPTKAKKEFNRIKSRLPKWTYSKWGMTEEEYLGETFQMYGRSYAGPLDYEGPKLKRD